MTGGSSGSSGTSPPPEPGADEGGESAGSPGAGGGVPDAGGTTAGQPDGSPAPRSAGVSPAVTGWFARLVARDCAGVVGGSGDEAVLVDALRAVCPAVMRGGRPDWAAAAAADRRLGDVAWGGCVDSVGFALLHQVLALHRAHPLASFHVTESAPGEQCEAGT